MTGPKGTGNVLVMKEDKVRIISYPVDKVHIYNRFTTLLFVDIMTYLQE